MGHLNEKNISWGIGSLFAAGVLSGAFLLYQQMQAEKKAHAQAIEEVGGVTQPEGCDVIYDGFLQDRYLFEVEAAVCENNTATYEAENKDTGTLESILVDFNTGLATDVMKPNSLRFSNVYQASPDDGMRGTDFLKDDVRYHHFAKDMGVFACLALEGDNDLNAAQQATAKTACDYVGEQRRYTEAILKAQMRVKAP